MSLNVMTANLIGVFLEAIAYGAYMVLFIEHMKIMYGKRNRGWAFLYMVATSVSLFLLISVHAIWDIFQMMQAFTDNMSTPNAPLLYFNFDLKALPGSALSTTATLISDAFLVYRLFTVWGNNFLIAAIPFLMYLTEIGLLAWAEFSLGQLVINQHKSVASIIRSVVHAKYAYAMTLAVNVVCSLLIAARIWMVQRVASGHIVGSPRTSGIAKIFIESAAIYSIMWIALLTTTFVGSPAMFLILQLTSPVNGIVFSSIIVRIDSQKEAQETQVSILKFNRGSRTTATHSTRTRLDTIQNIEDGMHIELTQRKSDHSTRNDPEDVKVPSCVDIQAQDQHPFGGP